MGSDPTGTKESAEVFERAALTIQSLVKALEPFAEAWDTATRDQRHLTMGEIGALAGHQVSGIHFRIARAEITKLRGGS